VRNGIQEIETAFENKSETKLFQPGNNEPPKNILEELDEFQVIFDFFLDSFSLMLSIFNSSFPADLSNEFRFCICLRNVAVFVSFCKFLSSFMAFYRRRFFEVISKVNGNVLMNSLGKLYLIIIYGLASSFFGYLNAFTLLGTRIYVNNFSVW
jgi:hypothetical protein